jgi:hypothetical protein
VAPSLPTPPLHPPVAHPQIKDFLLHDDMVLHPYTLIGHPRNQVH